MHYLCTLHSDDCCFAVVVVNCSSSSAVAKYLEYIIHLVTSEFKLINTTFYSTPVHLPTDWQTSPTAVYYGC